MAKRRIAITGVSRFLGLRLAQALAGADDVGTLIGVDLDEPPITIPGLEFVRADIRSPLIARVLEATKVDTLVHTNIASSPQFLGGRTQMKENNVIGSMQLLAAAQRATRLKKVVMRSSSAIYGSGPAEPSLLPEDHAASQVELSGYGKDCAEAETYARDFGRRRPDVDLVILRTQPVVGPTVRTSMTDYLSLPIIPTALGFDPRLQLLHERDAVDALSQSIFRDCRGIFNVAADGVVYLSQAIRLLGKIELPLLLALAQSTASLLRRFETVDFPLDQLRLIVYGRVVDTRRAREAFGFAPKFTTRDTLIDFKENRADDYTVEPSERRPGWERELFDYLNRRSAPSREKV
ncbi:MAG TPA: NAD-dependent epimerase/dehydratase family protein [Actinomycetota bacterium]|nr:NAD-dependent epimerase/dehydratase family protein [Actinomycetota bacterium]